MPTVVELRSDGTALAPVAIMKTSNDHLMGRTVISGDGIVIGEIRGLLVDTTLWQVVALQVALRKESGERIGIKHSIFHTSTLEIAVAQIQSVGDAIVLSVALDALRPPNASSPEPVAPRG
jgi:sporulation protein YlmC with PRC-barrel domain